MGRVITLRESELTALIQRIVTEEKRKQTLENISHLFYQKEKQAEKEQLEFYLLKTEHHHSKKLGSMKYKLMVNGKNYMTQVKMIMKEVLLLK